MTVAELHSSAIASPLAHLRLPMPLPVLAPAIAAQGALEIQELDPEQGVTLRLLDPTTVDAWEAGLPVRLRKLHSHWYCLDRKAVLLRPIPVQQREVAFMLHRTSAPGADWTCCAVPRALRARPWTALTPDLLTFDRLVMNALDPHLATSLAKFEAPEVTHTLVTPDGRLKIALPRFELEFVHENGGRLRSVNFVEYCLADRFVPLSTCLANPPQPTYPQPPITAHHNPPQPTYPQPPITTHHNLPQPFTTLHNPPRHPIARHKETTRRAGVHAAMLVRVVAG